VSIAKNNYKHQHRSLGAVYVYSIHTAVAAGPTLNERAIQYNKGYSRAKPKFRGSDLIFLDLFKGILKRL